MDPGTIAGITIGAVAGALIVGTVGRNMYVTRKIKKRTDILGEIRADFIDEKNGLSRNPKTGATTIGRGKRHNSKKTRRQYTKK